VTYTKHDNGDHGPPGLDSLEVELDARLLSLWLQAWEVEEWDPEVVGPFLRLAYGTGYHDALTEVRRGELYRTLGQLAPPRNTQ